MVKIEQNTAYEAAFRRLRADEPTPEEVELAALRRVRLKRLGIAAAVLAVVGIVGGAVLHLRKDTPAKQLVRAKAYQAKDEHRAAIVELKRSLQGDPAQPGARFLLGNELVAVGDLKNAQIEYQRALDGGFPPEEVMVPLARAALRQKDYATVVRLVNDANIESPQVTAELQTILGSAYFGQGKEQAGYDALGVARQFVPRFKPAAVAEARYLMVLGNPDGAARVIDSVSKDGREDAELLSMRGDLARLKSDFLQAQQFYEAAIRVDPRDMLIRINFAQNAMDLNQFDMAREQIRVVLQTLPTSARAQYLAAAIAYARKDLIAAKDAIEKAVQLSPKDGAILLLAGVVARETGDLLKAELHLREAVAVDPVNLTGRRMLVELYLQRQEPGKAAEAIQPVLSAVQTNPSIASLAAKIAMQSGDAAAAAQLFDKVSGGRLGDSRTTIVGASLKIAAGQEATGFAQLAAAAKADPNNAEIDVAMIVAHLQLNQVDAALAAWRSLAAKQPSNPRTDRLRALIAIDRNDVAGARAALMHALSIDPKDFLAIVALVDLDLRENHPDQARSRLQAYIATAAQPTDALVLLARVEENSGAPAGTVVDLLDRAEKASPRSVQVAREQAAFHDRNKDTAKAILAIRRGLAIGPDDQPLLSLWADIDQRSGQTDRALATLTRLVALNQEVPDYTMRLAFLQLRTGKTEAALTSYRNVLKRNPAREDLQSWMMTLLLEAGRVDEAERLLFEISKATPDSPVVARYSGDVKLAKKQLPEAISAYRQAMATVPGPETAIRLSKALDAAKRRDESSAVIDDWLRGHPTDENALLYVAQRSTALLDYERAIAAYRIILDGHPNDARILNNLAWVLGRKKDASALEYADRASTLSPEDPDIGDTRAEILIQRGDTAEGLRLLQKVSTQVPQRTDIKLRLARAQIVGGQKDSARQTLRELVDAAPESNEGKQSKQLLTTLTP